MKERKTAGSRRLRRVAVVLVIVVLMIMGMLAATKFIHDSIYPRFDRTAIDNAVNLNYTEIDDGIPYEKFTFMSGENTLMGYILGYENADKLLVIAPGFSDGAEDYTTIALSFVRLGYRVLSFDTTGSFESQGESSVGFSQIVTDLDSVLKFTQTRADLKKLPLFLFGHSRGGYAAAMMCMFDHNITAIATVGAVNSPMEITMEWSKNYAGNFAYTGYPTLYAYQSMVFGKDIMSTTCAEALDLKDTPALIIHCRNDETVSITGASIYAHKDEVENENAEFMLYDKEKNSGHTTLLYTPEANFYRDKALNRYEMLKERFDGNIPETEEEKFLSEIDPLKAKEPNEELVKIISDFYISKIT